LPIKSISLHIILKIGYLATTVLRLLLE